MSTATHPSDVRLPAPTLGVPLESSRALAKIVAGYLALVLPRVCHEVAHWRALAARIPDPELRAPALHSLGKRGNIEGGALFATLAPAPASTRVAALSTNIGWAPGAPAPARASPARSCDARSCSRACCYSPSVA